MSENQSAFSPIRTVKNEVHDRGIVLISSYKSYILKILPSHFLLLIPYLRIYSQFNRWLNPSKYYPPFIEINEARKSLDFPIGHPIDGNVYGTSELDPKRYVPIASFHNDMYQSKLSFFMDMCSSLGVKECSMIEMCQNGKIIEVNIEGAENNTEAEIESSFRSDKSSVIKMQGNFSFPKPKHKIEKIESKWLLTELTWRKMQEIRTERDISSYEVEFNIENDFGINTSTLAKFNGNKFSLGGEFKEFTKTSYLYRIDFWEK